MDERILVDRFSLDDPDWDLLEFDLSEDEPEDRSESCLLYTSPSPRD